MSEHEHRRRDEEREKRAVQARFPLRERNEAGGGAAYAVVMNEDALPQDGAAILVDGALAGRVTSARYSPKNGKAVGLAWVIAKSAAIGMEIQVRVNGSTAPARIVEEAFYDPAGERLRM